ncbi:MAG TPA: GNAT family protein [bacterium]|nr:GNAT family protein [bacterium]
MSYFKKLVGEKCYLSPIRMEDAEIYTIWFNDMEMVLYVAPHPSVISLFKEKEFIENQLKSGAPIFGIIDIKTDKIIGNTSLMDINQINGTATLGIVIGEKDYWDKGYGTEAVKLILDYGFNILNLHNIMLCVFDFNKRAVASYKKIGFKEIGIRREDRLIARHRHNSVFMDILATEFESPFIKGIADKL